MFKHVCLCVSVIMLLTALSGCAVPELSDEYAGQTDIAVTAENAPDESLPVFSKLPLSTYMGGRDPLEGFNRSVFYGVDFFYYYLYRPLGYIYGSIMPRPGIRLINNATDNLEYPRRLLGNLLQAQFTGAGIETLRFLTNSTLGIAGLFDPATHWFGLPKYNEDFGQAFAAWGIGPGCVLQLAYSSNIRDGVGMIFDYAVDIKSYFYGGQAFTFLNRGLDPFSQYDMLRESTFDSYQALKDYQLLVRYLQISNWQPAAIYVEVDEKGNLTALQPREPHPEEDITILADFYSQSPEVDSLRTAWMRPSYDSLWSRLSFFNHDFTNLSHKRSVEIAPGKKMSYRYWANEDPAAPLVVILPGLGGFNNAAMAQALAELCVNNKMSALIISNTMTWEFVEAFDSPPGFTPDDAAKLEMALGCILDDLYLHAPSFQSVPKMLMGYSQGALHALFLMDRQYRKLAGKTLKFERALAINPPVDLLSSLQVLDEYMCAMDKCSTAEALSLLAAGAGSYVYTVRYPAQIRTRFAEGSNPERVEELKKIREGQTIDQVPVTQQIAQIIIAYSFKRSLDDLLVSMHHQAAVPQIVTPYQWGNRQALYDELAAWNYKKYCESVLVNYYQKQNNKLSLEQLNEQSGLRAITDTLRNHPGIMVYHNTDDFLLNKADRTFLSDTLNERILWFDRGGHLGNLYRDDVQKKIVEYLQYGVSCAEK